MSLRVSLLVATSNRGKLDEVRALLSDLPLDVVALGDALPELGPIREDGATFAENALLKARAASTAATMLTLADDSGLEVDALGGRPGVRSARYAKEGATDAENNATLLSALDEVDEAQRSARFRCAVALVDPWAESDARELVVHGCCEGAIARHPRGSGGFGYDPLFLVAGLGRTMAELDEAEKNTVSHRASALAKLRPTLARLVAERLATTRRILEG